MITLSLLSLLIWIYLLGAHGRFWQAGPILPSRFGSSWSTTTAPTAPATSPGRWTIRA
jgi:hypothetical protein